MTLITPLFTLGIDHDPDGENLVFDVYQLEDSAKVGVTAEEDLQSMLERHGEEWREKEPESYEGMFMIGTEEADEYVEELRRIVGEYGESDLGPLRDSKYLVEVYDFEDLDHSIARFQTSDVPRELVEITGELTVESNLNYLDSGR